MTFQYKTDVTGKHFPVISVRLVYQEKIIDSSALIDSGATISIFKSDVAQNLKIKIEGRKEIILGGVGGRIRGYVHSVKTEIAGKMMVIPIVFSHEYLVSFNLLGRDTFFENFLITFDEKNKKLELK